MQTYFSAGLAEEAILLHSTPRSTSQSLRPRINCFRCLTSSKSLRNPSKPRAAQSVEEARATPTTSSVSEATLRTRKSDHGRFTSTGHRGDPCGFERNHVSHFAGRPVPGKSGVGRSHQSNICNMTYIVPDSKKKSVWVME